MLKKTACLILLFFIMNSWSDEVAVFETDESTYIQTLDIDNHNNGALVLIKNTHHIYEGESNQLFVKFTGTFDQPRHYSEIKDKFENGFVDLVNQSSEEGNILVLRIGSSEIEDDDYTHRDIESVSYIKFDFKINGFPFNGVVTGMRIKRQN